MICASQWVRAGSRRSLPRPSLVARRNVCAPDSTRRYSLTAIIQGLRRGERAAQGGDPSSWGLDSRKRKATAQAAWESNGDTADAGGVASSRAWSARDGGSGYGREAIRRPGNGSRVDQRPQIRRESRDLGRTTKALEGSASERQRHKLRRKLSRKTERLDDSPDDSGRQTRRRRFLDPDSQFGKKSMVYLIKHGGLGGAVKSPDPVHAKPRRAPLDSRRRSFPVEAEEPSSAAISRVAGSNLRRADAFRSPPTQQFQRPGAIYQGEILELASAGSIFVYGRSSVKAALEHGRRKLYRLYMYQNRKEERIDDVITQLAQRRRVDIKMVPIESRGLLDKMSAGRPHNGIVLEASPLPQLPVLSLGPIEESPGRLGFNVTLNYQSREEETVNGKSSFVPRAGLVTPKPFVLLLNNILDPGNLGALLRSAHYFGIDAVAITTRSSSGLSAAALKAASGAAEEVRLFSVPDSVQFVQQSKMAGWKTYAAVPPPSKRLIELHGEKFISEHTVEREDPLQHSPCLLVLGNEGEGLNKALKTAIDYEVAIAKFIEHTQLDSLNVSVAGALLCHSFVKGSSAAKVEAEAPAKQGMAGVEAGAVAAEGQPVEPKSERMF